jgi:hypothetical protein
VKDFAKLRREFSCLDFSTIPDFSWYSHYEDETVLNEDRLQLTTAALLHYKFDVATLVRYLGGLHTGFQCSTQQILDTLWPSVKKHTWRDLERILTLGSPAHLNAHSTDSNFAGFLEHGNHKSAVDNPDATPKVFLKGCRRGHGLALDLRVLPFVMHLHLTPLGIVDIDDPWKKQRPVFPCHQQLEGPAMTDNVRDLNKQADLAAGGGTNLTFQDTVQIL